MFNSIDDMQQSSAQACALQGQIRCMRAARDAHSGVVLAIFNDFETKSGLRQAVTIRERSMFEGITESIPGSLSIILPSNSEKNVEKCSESSNS